VPDTVKVRKGIHDGLLTYLDAGRVAEEEGAAAIGLHARTAAQLYAGDADWSASAALTTAGRSPVLGNGDVWECRDALRMLRATGCDGVIVGRGCLRRPWLFAELAAVFDGREPAPQPRLGEIAAIMRDHAERLMAFFGPARGIRQMRKWCLWYTSGFHGAAQLRADLIRIESLEEMLGLLARLDRDEPLPPDALRRSRSKSSHTQADRLPDGYLAARRADTALAAGDVVEIAARGPRAALPPGLVLVYEDGDVIVVEKPAGLLTIATERERERTVYAHLMARARTRKPPARVFVVHRLDRLASGLLVFAMSPVVKRALQSQFAAHGVERTYLAVVEGRLARPEGTIASRLLDDAPGRVRETARPGPGP